MPPRKSDTRGATMDKTDRDWHMINAATCASPLVDLPGGTIVSERSIPVASSIDRITSPTNTSGTGRQGYDEGFVLIDLNRPTYSQVLGLADLTGAVACEKPDRSSRQSTPVTTVLDTVGVTPLPAPAAPDTGSRSTPSVSVAPWKTYADRTRWQYADVQLRKSGKHYVPVAACRG